MRAVALNFNDVFAIVIFFVEYGNVGSVVALYSQKFAVVLFGPDF